MRKSIDENELGNLISRILSEVSYVKDWMDRDRVSAEIRRELEPRLYEIDRLTRHISKIFEQ